MRRADLLIGIGLLAFAALYYRESFAITVGFASDRLGPTFFPRLLALLLAACGIALIRRSATGRSDANPLPAVRIGLFAWTVGLTLAYAVLLTPLGYLVATMLYMLAMSLALGYRQILGLFGSAVAVTITLYLVFARALHVLVPMGPFWR